MESFILIIVLTIVAILIIAAASAKVEAGKRDEAQKIVQDNDRRFVANKKEFAAKLFQDWPFLASVKVNNEIHSFLAMNEAGSLVRIIICRKFQKTNLETLNDVIIKIEDILSIDVKQDSQNKLVTHVDKIPVAVGSGRSPVSRAVVGGLIAGPAGLVIGGISGLGGKSKIVTTPSEREETVVVKGDPQIIIQTSNIALPCYALTFKEHSELNLWSSRIHAAMNKR